MFILMLLNIPDINLKQLFIKHKQTDAQKHYERIKGIDFVQTTLYYFYSHKGTHSNSL